MAPYLHSIILLVQALQIPLTSSAPHIAINFFGYVYIIVQIAAILIGALILYRNNEAKKAAAGMAIPMNAYQVPVQSTNTPQYPTVNPTPAATTSNQPQAENQSQAESQPQFCPAVVIRLNLEPNSAVIAELRSNRFRISFNACLVGISRPFDREILYIGWQPF